MTALIIITIVACGFVMVFPNMIALMAGDDEDRTVALFNLVPLALAITTLSILLGKM